MVENSANGLLSALEHIPIPIAVGFGPDSLRVVTNAAFRNAAGTNAYEAQPLLQRAARGEDIHDFDVELRRTDGSASFCVASAWPLRNEGGEIYGSIAVFRDRTLENSERRYRLISEAMPQFVWLDAPDGSALYANERWLQYTGLTDEENRGWGWLRVAHPDDLRRLERSRERSLQSGDIHEGECRYRGRDGKYRWFLFRTIPVRDENGQIASWLGTATDIDRQKRAEAQQRFFAQASATLAATLDVETTLRRAAELGASLGTWCEIDLANETGVLKAVVTAHRDERKARILERLVGRECFMRDAPAGPPAVLRSNQSQLIPRTNEDIIGQVIPDPECRAIYREVGYSTGMIVPLQVGDRTIGTLGIASDDPSQLYTEFDTATAVELARRVAIAIENAQSFAREHRLASTLQRALLPAHLPQSDAITFRPAYAAASSAGGEAVGGDWYDAFALRDGSIAFSIGDVAGHGVDAAVTMNVVRQAIRAAALEHLQPDRVLARANDLLALETQSAMVTAFFGVVDPQARSLSFAIAGHPRPLLVHPDGNVDIFGEGGVPLGTLFEHRFIVAQSHALPVGSTIVLYTDGLLEYNREIETAEARLIRTASERRFLASANPAQALIDAALLGEQRDDIAVLLAFIHPRAGEPLALRMPAHAYAVPIVRDTLARYACAHGANDDALFLILTATGEALANAVEHAYRGEAGDIEVYATHHDGVLSVRVRDFGAWREPHPTPDRGFGTGLMKGLARSVHVEPTPSGTAVSLTFML